MERIQILHCFCPTSAAMPRIEVTPNTFKIILPNLNATIVDYSANEQEQLILDYIAENGSVTDAEIQELLHIKPTRTYAIMKSMREKGLVTQQGRGTNKKYFAAH